MRCAQLPEPTHRVGTQPRDPRRVLDVRAFTAVGRLEIMICGNEEIVEEGMRSSVESSEDKLRL